MALVRQAAVAFILVTVGLDVLSLGLVIPVQPKLVEMFMGGDTARAAGVFGAMSAAWALMQFVFSPILGALSDRFGRRPVVLISNFGLGLDFLLMALSPNVGWLFVGRFISGICAASFSTATAYIADITPMERRASAFGLIGAAFGFGFVAGPAIGGLLGGENPRLPFWVAAGFSLANAAYGYFVLPESLPKEHRRTRTWAEANPLGSLRLIASDRILAGLSASALLHYLAHSVLPALTVLYAGYRYEWGPRNVGLMLALVGICSAVVQGALIKPTVARFGPRVTLITGLLAGAAAMVMFGLAASPAMYLAGVPLAALWGFTGPSMQQITTGRIGADRQGQWQGANSSLMAIGNLVGPLMMAQIFAHSIAWGSTYVGTAYIFAALLLVAAASFAAVTLRQVPVMSG